MNFGIDRHPDRAEKLKQGIKYNPEVKALLDDGVLDKVDKIIRFLPRPADYLFEYLQAFFLLLKSSSPLASAKFLSNEALL